MSMPSPVPVAEVDYIPHHAGLTAGTDGYAMPAHRGQSAAIDLQALCIYETAADGSPDLSSRRDLARGEVVTLHPDRPVYLGCGFDMHIRTPGIAAVVLPRSSSSRFSLALGNTIGLIDPDYTGAIIMGMKAQTGSRPVTVSEGERITQMMLIPYFLVRFQHCDSLVKTDRGNGGYGSSGR